MAFLQGLQIGANIGNMRVAQQERMMQLRSQAALNAIHERQLAAQADMLAQHAALYKQQALKEQDDALTEKSVLAAAQDHHDYLINEVGLTEDQAAPEVIGAVSRVVPKLGDTMAQSYERVKRAQTEAIGKANFKPFVGQITGPDGKTLNYFQSSPQSARLIKPDGELGGVAQPVTDPNGKVIGYQVQGANGPHFISPPTANAMDPQDRMELGSLYRQREEVDKQLRANPEIEIKKGWFHPTATESAAKKTRDDLLAERESITQKINSFRAPTQTTAKLKAAAAVKPPKLELKLNSRYRDAEGNERVYRGQDDEGNPIWEESD